MVLTFLIFSETPFYKSSKILKIKKKYTKDSDFFQEQVLVFVQFLSLLKTAA